jgi:hypothetical protein
MPESVPTNEDALQDAPGPVGVGDAGPEKANSPAATGKVSRREIGGPSGPEPTRYGDWERNGRCTDF